MYVKLMSNQDKILNSAMEKAGSDRKLSKMINIPKASIARYKSGGAIPQERFERILNFLKIEKSTVEIKEFKNNWKQSLGGQASVKIKKENGTFEEQLRKAQKSGGKFLVGWHERMKRKDPKRYHLMQQEKFRRIGVYKCMTIKGERVRNKFEKAVADKLTELRISYEYEPLLRRGKKWFFPDFLINKKIIIECTEWTGEVKAYQLQEKIKNYGGNYTVFVVIPKHLYTKYKILDKHLILGVDEIARVAQLG